MNKRYLKPKLNCNLQCQPTMQGNLNLVQGTRVCVSLFRDLGNVAGVNMRNISYYTPTSSPD